MGLDVPKRPSTSEETARLVRHWRRRRWLWGVVGVILVLFVVAGTTTWLRDGLQLPLVLHESPQPADVIIVLGSGTEKTGDHLRGQAKQRVIEGVNVLQAGFAPRLIVSGGQDSNTTLVEADEMKAFAIVIGAPADAIFEERQSQDTFQNAKFSHGIMLEHDWRTALVVTSPYHTWRSCRIFRAQDIDVRCVTAPYSLFTANSFLDHLYDTKSVVREYGAILYNWLNGEL